MLSWKDNPCPWKPRGPAHGRTQDASLMFRILTFWLPTVPGYLVLQYTQRKGIV